MSPDSDDATVRAACLRFLKRSHPDKGGDPQAFMFAKRVYDTLKDQRARRAYDVAEPELETDVKPGFGEMVVQEVIQSTDGWCWYKEPAFVASVDDMARVMEWRALIERRAKEFRFSMVFDVGIVEDGPDFSIQDDIALIDRDAKPQLFAASAYVLERMCKA